MMLFYLNEAAFEFANCLTCVLKKKKKEIDCATLKFFFYEDLGIWLFSCIYSTLSRPECERGGVLHSTFLLFLRRMCRKRFS